MRGQYDEAVADARRAVKLAPGSADVADLAGFFLARPHPLHLPVYHGNFMRR
ncbi:MAG: hypothetical protein WBL40_04585 [Terrimicrobiaceae bacterium]